MMSCLFWDGHLVPAQCCLHGLAICLSVQLLAQGWLQDPVFFCLSVLGQVMVPAPSPTPSLGQALGLLGEESQLGQRHLLPQPCDLPEHRLCILPHQALLDVADVGKEVAHGCDPGPGGWRDVVVALGVPKPDSVATGAGKPT